MSRAKKAPPKLAFPHPSCYTNGEGVLAGSTGFQPPKEWLCTKVAQT